MTSEKNQPSSKPKPPNLPPEDPNLMLNISSHAPLKQMQEQPRVEESISRDKYYAPAAKKSRINPISCVLLLIFGSCILVTLIYTIYFLSHVTN